MSDLHFQGVWRMDWGLGNPNKTAALIAMLCIAVWVFAYVWKWGFWAALLPFTTLAICLIHTLSRGGVIAIFAGAGILLAWTPRPWPPIKVITLGLSLCLVIFASIYLQAHERFGQGVVTEDRSITNRFELWKAAPAMMRDAPGGWGIGKSGQAYLNWYQPLDRQEIYRTLVNSHLTWLVEIGWLWRFLYLFAWFAIFLLFWPDTKTRWLAVPFGIWAAFGVAAIFSSVAESPWLWILPGVSLVGVLFYHAIHRTWPAKKAWLLPVALAFGVCVYFFFAGQNDQNLHLQDGIVTFGKGSPDWLILADERVIGASYGRTLRKYAKTHSIPTMDIISQDAETAANWTGSNLVLAGIDSDFSSGKTQDYATRAHKILILCPKALPQDLGFSETSLAKAQVFCGEFSQSPATAAWCGLVAVNQLPGIADFLQDWPKVIFPATEHHADIPKP